MAVEFNENDVKIISSNADYKIVKPDGEVYEDPSDMPNREE